MARPRLPAEVAATTGADKRSPGRFKDRPKPKSVPLGAPPAKFNAHQKAAWRAFADEMPWLNKSDRTVVQVASRLRAAMENDPQFPMAGFAQLRMCLSAMGGTPADRTKVSAPDEKDDDPLDQFMQ